MNMLHRSFIAILLERPFIKDIASLILELKKKNTDRLISFVKPENVHSTLHFLGGIDEKQMVQVDTLLHKAVKEIQPFQISFGELRGFPNLKEPRVLFVAGRGDTKLAQTLQKAIGSGLENLGFVVDSRPWVLHYTLARVKKPISLNFVTCILPSKAFKVANIYLMESILGRGGPFYNVLKTYPLGV